MATKDRTGETNYNHQGFKMTIIAYRSTRDIDVLFENGHIEKHRQYNDFKKGGIKNRSIPLLTWKYHVGQTIKDDKRNLIIVDTEIREKRTDNKRDHCLVHQKWYKYSCNKCGWDEGWMIESSLAKGQGCSCCAGVTAVKGINTLGDKKPELVQFFKNSEDAFKYTYYSKQEVNLICPICQHERTSKVGQLYRYDFFCNQCGDNISYPEKFMMSVFNQFNIDYQYQLSKKTFKWVNKYYYDFYLPDYNYIIEVHGDQHFNKAFTTNHSLTLEEVKHNDRLKRELALSNGIDDYFEIDCHLSNSEVIVNGILQSGICEKLYIDISKLDVRKCELDASKNLLKEVCEFYNNHKDMTPPMIAPYFHVNRVTILDYLKKGSKIGLCNYDVEKAKIESRLKGAHQAKLSRQKRVEVFKDNVSLGVFACAKDVVEYFFSTYNIKLNASNISAVCLGKYKQHKGYVFKYVD